MTSRTAPELLIGSLLAGVVLMAADGPRLGLEAHAFGASVTTSALMAVPFVLAYIAAGALATGLAVTLLGIPGCCLLSPVRPVRQAFSLRLAATGFAWSAGLLGGFAILTAIPQVLLGSTQPSWWPVADGVELARSLGLAETMAGAAVEAAAALVQDPLVFVLSLLSRAGALVLVVALVLAATRTAQPLGRAVRLAGGRPGGLAMVTVLGVTLSVAADAVSAAFWSPGLMFASTLAGLIPYLLVAALQVHLVRRLLLEPAARDGHTDPVPGE
jgi:hypothetical protein